MNATQVEIHRIQTRLQKLGGSKKTNKPQNENFFDNNVHKTKAVQLPDNPTTSHHISHMSENKGISSMNGHSLSEEPVYHSTNSQLPQNNSPLTSDNRHLSVAFQKTSVPHPSSISTQAQSAILDKHAVDILNQAVCAPRLKPNSINTRDFYAERDAGVTAEPNYDSNIQRQNSKESFRDYDEVTHTDLNHYLRNLSKKEPANVQASTPDGIQGTKYLNEQHRNVQCLESDKFPFEESLTSVQTSLIHQWPQPNVPVDDRLQHLNAMARRVNAISDTLIMALQEMEVFAGKLEHQRMIASTQGKYSPSERIEGNFLTCESRSVTIPYIKQLENGSLAITSSPIAELYFLNGYEGHPPKQGESIKRRSFSASPSTGLLSVLFSRLLGQRLTPKTKQSGFVSAPHQPLRKPKSRHKAQKQNPQCKENNHSPTPKTSSPPWQKDLIWMASAMIVRIGLDAILLSYPLLWPPAIALVMTPAAIAIYRTTVSPRSGFLAGRRLLIIMIGLLLGGRM